MINRKIEDLLSWDIETCPKFPSLDLYPDQLQEAFTNKALKMGLTPLEFWEKEISFMPEMSKIVAVSYGKLVNGKFVVKAIGGEDEKEILETLIIDFDANRTKSLTGHFISGFDIPFTNKRILLNKLGIPELLRTYNQKPWEQTITDTKTLWSMGVFGGQGASLEMLCAAMEIPSSKSTMSGKDVKGYYFAGKYRDIASYCSEDVIACMRACQFLAGKEIISNENVKITIIIK